MQPGAALTLVPQGLAGAIVEELPGEVIRIDEYTATQRGVGVRFHVSSDEMAAAIEDLLEYLPSIDPEQAANTDEYPAAPQKSAPHFRMRARLRARADPRTLRVLAG